MPVETKRGVKRPGRELERIQWIRALEGRAPSAAFALGIGDDAAIWTPAKGSSVVLTVDAQVDGVHFRRAWLSPREIGRRAVAAAVSDLAAMAARPACLLVSMTLERQFAERDFRSLQLGIKNAAQSYGMRILGGNLSSGPFSITVTALGEGDPSRLIRRSGARPGDDVWVTGKPGLARLGLLCLRRGLAQRSRSARSTSARWIQDAIRAFKNPVARVREALEIARSWRPRAMIDLSDGLAADLRHIITESAGRRPPPGAVIEESAFLGMKGLEPLARLLGTAAASAALAGGDDYELCFTAAPHLRPGKQATAFERKFGLKVTRVGKLIERPGIWLRRLNGSIRAVTEEGWEHFRK